MLHTHKWKIIGYHKNQIAQEITKKQENDDICKNYF